MQHYHYIITILCCFVLFSSNTIAEIFPQILNFASQEIGTTSEIQEVFVASEKNDMTINNIAITGEFSKTSNCKGIIEVGDKCSIRITFSPTSKGWHQETLTISSTSAGESKTDIVFIEGIGFYGEVPNTTRLINISTRAPVRGGENNAIAGFIITGTGTKKVAIQALGTGLAPNLPAGSEVLSDSKVVLYQMINGSFQVIANNDNWQNDSRASEMPAHMQLPAPSDAGFIIDLIPGTYTAIVQPASGSITGATLVSVNDLDDTNTSKLINISTRAPIEGGVGNVIAGFIIDGTGTQQVVITAQGKGINMSQNLLCQDTTMSVHKMVNGHWAEIANNDNWQEDAQAINIPAHFHPTDPSDAALLLNLEAAAYTAIMGCNNGTGIGLIGVNAID